METHAPHVAGVQLPTSDKLLSLNHVVGAVAEAVLDQHVGEVAQDVLAGVPGRGKVPGLVPSARYCTPRAEVLVWVEVAGGVVQQPRCRRRVQAEDLQGIAGGCQAVRVQELLSPLSDGPQVRLV